MDTESDRPETRDAWHTHADMLSALEEAPFVPTVFPLDADRLAGFVELLAEEGFPVIEMLCRPVGRALPLLEKLLGSPLRDAIRWGIGTVRDAETARRAADLRPDFIVSPAFSRQVLEVAVGAGIPYVPGVYTLQDVQDVIDAFSEHDQPVRALKLCPAFDVDDDYLQALRGCFPGIYFCPTGEMLMRNYYWWAGREGVVAPMGSQLVQQSWIEQGDAQSIRRRLQLLRMMCDDARGGE